MKSSVQDKHITPLLNAAINVAFFFVYLKFILCIIYIREVLMKNSNSINSINDVSPSIMKIADYFINKNKCYLMIMNSQCTYSTDLKDQKSVWVEILSHYLLNISTLYTFVETTTLIFNEQPIVKTYSFYYDIETKSFYFLTSKEAKQFYTKSDSKLDSNWRFYDFPDELNF
jgi:hypothetical protein